MTSAATDEQIDLQALQWAERLLKTTIHGSQQGLDLPYTRVIELKFDIDKHRGVNGRQRVRFDGNPSMVGEIIFYLQAAFKGTLKTRADELYIQPEHVEAVRTRLKMLTELAYEHKYKHQRAEYPALTQFVETAKSEKPCRIAYPVGSETNLSGPEHLDIKIQLKRDATEIEVRKVYGEVAKAMVEHDYFLPKKQDVTGLRPKSAARIESEQKAERQHTIADFKVTFSLEERTVTVSGLQSRGPQQRLQNFFNSFGVMQVTEGYRAAAASR